MPTPVDSSIAEALLPVERKRELVARTLGPEPHIHTDTDGNSRVADSNTGTGGNSTEVDKPGQLPLRCQSGFQCRSAPVPEPTTMTVP